MKREKNILTLWDRVYNDLVGDIPNSGSGRLLTVKEYPIRLRYSTEEVTPYMKDDGDGLRVAVEDEKRLDFARKVAKAYNLPYREVGEKICYTAPEQVREDEDDELPMLNPVVLGKKILHEFVIYTKTTN